MLPIAILAVLAPLAAAHMEMTSPPPLRSKYNDNADTANVDYSMTSPLEASGSNFPCKGYLADTTGKESVASWAAGSSQQVTLEGSAIHEGGSCQLSISEDEGATFKVIKSFIGNCPASTGPVTMDVDIPADVKNGDVVFAWTWNNRVGNREIAIVTIDNGGAGLTDYPDMFVAQLSDINTCTVPEGTDVDYPNPGTQVERADADDAIGAPVGDCGATGTGSPSTSASVPATSSAPATSVGVSVSASVSIPATSSPATTSSPAATSAASSSAPAPTSSSTAGETCTEGAVRCDTDTTWSECGSGLWQSQGSVPGGMTCKDGAIVPLSRKRAMSSHKRHWASRGPL
ncbi:hypothetical protein BD626DRAFT_576902 [Schizophyllum amplum]|uniref:Chitin-binding type-4 domain-containing protein n=1 Tax=Schizophyllum amplum TaxID=97359 RepID=A0A550BSY6_9AGAR|nr:hypothetical protein BD626DRAFT_576902 [Auriculariopsis ampla]